MAKKNKAKCECLFAEHKLHDQLLQLEDGLPAVNLAFDLVTMDYGMTVEDLQLFVRQHNWRSPVQVDNLVDNVEWLDRMSTAKVWGAGVCA